MVAVETKGLIGKSIGMGVAMRVNGGILPPHPPSGMGTLSNPGTRRSKPAGVIHEGPRNPKFPGKLGRERLNAKGLGCVMAAVEGVDPQILRQRMGPMRSLSGDEGVHAFTPSGRSVATRQ